MDSALIGLVGVLIGALITEYFRRKSRLESFSGPIFEKRLAIYESLMNEFTLSYGVIFHLYEDNEISLSEKNDVAFHCGLKLMQFLDDNEFYLSEEIVVHIGMLFVGVSDVFCEEKTDECRKITYEKFKRDCGETKRLIKTASGISTIDKLLTEITDAKPNSEYIKYFIKIKKQYQQGKGENKI